MNKQTHTFLLLSLFLLLGSCYNDDPSPNNLSPLPFDNFEEFFAQNQPSSDTFSVVGNELTQVAGMDGVKIQIPADAFTEDIELVLKEVSLKSDLIFGNIGTLQNGQLLDLAQAAFVEILIDGNVSSQAAELGYQMPIINGFSDPSNIKLYQGQTQWNLCPGVTPNVFSSVFTFESDKRFWLAGASPIAVDAPATVKAEPNGYNTILTDLNAFLVLKNRNAVIPMNVDFGTLEVMANQVPSNEEVEIVLLGMDENQLFIGVETVDFSNSDTFLVNMIRVTEDEMIERLRLLDE